MRRHQRAAIDAYIRARRAYEDEAAAYWQSIADKRRARIAKRRNNETDHARRLRADATAGLFRAAAAARLCAAAPAIRRRRRRRSRASPIFSQAAAEQYNFVPDRPKTEAEFKQAYAKVAAAAGLTSDQAVRIYAFETGGNGTYDGQAGYRRNRKDARPISPAIGYNQLLSTNTVSLLAEHGDKFLAALNAAAEALSGRSARRWIARSRRSRR